MWGNRDQINSRYDEWEIHREGWRKQIDSPEGYNPLYDIPGMEYTNLQMRMTELQIAENNAAFFANIKGGEELADFYAAKVQRLRSD